MFKCGCVCMSAHENENALIGLYFICSLIQPYQIYSIEQVPVSGGDTNIENSIYETNKTKV